jgi:hypothetical protein
MTPDDDELLAELAAILPAPPPELVVAGKEIFTWRTVDGELAALTFDSLLDETAELVRSTTDAPRVLTFEAGTTAIDVELVDGRLVGHLSPPQSAELELIMEADRRTVPVDDRGRFTVDLPPATARVALFLRLADGTTIQTATLAI